MSGGGDDIQRVIAAVIAARSTLRTSSLIGPTDTGVIDRRLGKELGAGASEIGGRRAFDARPVGG